MRTLAIRWLPLLAVFSALGSGPVLAQSDKVAVASELTPAEAWVVINISGHARAKVAVTELQYQLQSRFLAADLDGDGTITQKDNDLFYTVARARLRGSHIVAWAAWDLNDDGQVTREEITIAHRQHTAGPVRIGDIAVSPTPAQRNEATARFVDKAMEPDSNGDGVITFDEIRAHANKLASQSRYGQDRTVPEVFDANNDGAIEATEFMDVVSRVLARVDADGNGRIDAEEAESMRLLRQAAQSVTRRR